MSGIDFEALQDPFEAVDIEWRLAQVNKKGSVITAKCLAYVTSRAIQERLDKVCGPAGWRNEFKAGPDGGVLCGISIRIPSRAEEPLEDYYEWVTKWDGAENTDIEPIKGGLSGAMKRAGSMWGIGRYLYYLPEAWAIINNGGRHWASSKIRGQDKRETFHWDNPSLPEWALPKGAGAPPEDQVNRETGEVTNSQMQCPDCNSPIWDNRADKKGGKIGNNNPDLKCSSSKCDWAKWMDTWQEEMLAELEAAHSAELIDAQERANAEEIVHSDAVEMMVKVQRRLNEIAGGE